MPETEAASAGPSPAELAEIDRIRNAFKSDGEGDHEDPITYAREIVGLREELANFRTWGIIEVAVRNPSVSEYMNHWENRATTAETSLAAARAEMRGANEAFAALDVADRLIERAYGTDVPKEWNDTYRAVARARSLTGGTDAG